MVLREGAGLSWESIPTMSKRESSGKPTNTCVTQRWEKDDDDDDNKIVELCLIRNGNDDVEAVGGIVGGCVAGGGSGAGGFVESWWWLWRRPMIDGETFDEDCDYWLSLARHYQARRGSLCILIDNISPMPEQLLLSLLQMSSFQSYSACCQLVTMPLSALWLCVVCSVPLIKRIFVFAKRHRRCEETQKSCLTPPPETKMLMMTMMMIQDIIKMYQIFRCLCHFYIYISLHWFSTFPPRPKALTNSLSFSLTAAVWLFSHFPFSFIFISSHHNIHLLLVLLILLCFFVKMENGKVWRKKNESKKRRKRKWKKEERKRFSSFYE